MLSEFQEHLASIVRQIPEADGFVLAGGAALIIHGRAERITRDLDFFARSPLEVDALLPALKAALLTSGYSVERRQVGTGFARLEITDGEDVSRIDLGYDFRLMPAEQSPLGPVLCEEELAADKVLAIHGRSEARDYLDLHDLVEKFGHVRPLEWATQKDPGFSRAVFAERLG